MVRVTIARLDRVGMEGAGIDGVDNGALFGQGLDQRRVSSVGFGPSQPIASNATPDGRAQNRRVEIQIIPTN